MNIFDILDDDLKLTLQKEIPILRAQIGALYTELDRKTGLRGASVPIVFGYEPEVLGSYTQNGNGEKEHFFFSLLFIGYAVAHPLSKEDRMDLYRHEYAHYMQYNMNIPEKYKWQPGKHGSAWKYCCSIVDAAPTPYYKAGEALMKHDYKKVLRNPIHDKMVPLKDQYRREQDYRKQKNTVVQFSIGDTIRHPRFGEGIIEEIQQTDSSVRLQVRFGEERKAIDQNWLLRSQKQSQNNK